jgi:hypothetical protein
MSTVTYRYENNLTHFVKDVKHTIKENILDGKEKGLSFFFLKKIGDKFYKLDVKELESKKFKVEEKIDEEVKNSEMSEAELLKMIKANKDLKFVESYMKNRKSQKGGAKKSAKKSSKKGSKKSSKKSTKKGSKKSAKKSTKKGSKKSAKKSTKKGSKKSAKKGSKKGSRKSTKKGSRKGSKRVVKKTSKKSKRSTA